MIPSGYMAGTQWVRTNDMGTCMLFCVPSILLHTTKFLCPHCHCHKAMQSNLGMMQLSGHHITIQALRAAPHFHFEISKGKKYPAKIQPPRQIPATRAIILHVRDSSDLISQMYELTNYTNCIGKV